MTDDRFKTGGAFEAMPDPEARVVGSLGGKLLGGYRVGGIIGSGGMGYVLHAARAEGDFDRAAAIKVVPATLGSSELAQRFRTEVQILGKLNHPFIAQLYDAGETDEGWPYLIMEYVDGSPITDYCSARQLSVDDRVILLIDVARAVRFAHTRLVVHRDLKPSNVFVDTQGRPKLLDFGIAKLLEPGTPEHTVGHRPMTPQYASPEQLLGADITTGSDIYQLGVLFISVLSNGSPFESVTLKEAIQNAASGHDAAISRQAAAELPDDLLAIVSRCLHSDPDDRYPDVNALINDLVRYKEGYPVDARKNTRLYRLKKLVQRNLPATAFATLAAVILAFGSMTYTINMAESRRLAEDRAATASQTLQAMSTLITDTYSELIESRTSRSSGQAAEEQLKNEPLRLLLERTERMIDSTVTDQPALRAELLLVQGMTNRQLGRFDTSAEQLNEALAIVEGRKDLGGQVSVLLEQMKLESIRDRIAAADDVAQRALELLDEVTVPAQLHGRLLTTAAVIAGKTDNLERSLEFAHQAVDILETAGPQARTDLARAYANLGNAYGHMEQAEPVREWFSKAVELFIDIEGPSYRGLSLAYNGLARSYCLSGDHEQCLAYIDKDLEVARANFGEIHVDFALGLQNKSVPLRRLSRNRDALTVLNRSLSIYDAIPGVFADRQTTIAINLGNVYRDMGRLDDAMKAYERGLSLADEPDVGRRRIASLLNNSGNLLKDIGQLDEAITRLGAARAEKAAIYGADHISTARTMLLLAEANIQRGTYDEVPALLALSRDIYVSTYGADDRKLSFFETINGDYLLAIGDIDQARAVLLTAHRHRLEEYNADNPIILPTLILVARAELAAGNLAAARSWLEKFEAPLESLPESAPESVEAAVFEAELLGAEKRYSDAEQARRRALRLIDEHVPARQDWKARL
ncbi:MAG: tetratricopeptide repeat protein [Pseudomonadota bacterium]